MNAEEFQHNMNTWSQQPRQHKATYYDQNFWPEVRTHFINTYPGHPEFDVLIIPVRNPHTAMLNLERYLPEVAVFVYSEQLRTENGQRLLEAPQQLKIGYEEAAPDMHPTDPVSVYQAVKQAYLRHQGKHIGVDIAGGTKAMSGGVAMAGSLIGADGVYIESRFDKHIQDRLPGGERRGKLPDPYIVLGEILRRRAQAFYTRHDYVTAHKLFLALGSRVEPPQYDQQFAHLAEAYAAWDAFNLPVAYARLGTLIGELDAAGWPVLGHAATPLRFQLAALGHLTTVQENLNDSPFAVLSDNPDAMLALLGSLYSNALRRESQGRYDLAALLLYRCLELMSQRRLAVRGVDADARHITLMKGYGQLESLCDPLVWSPAEASEQPRLIDRIRVTTTARNKSLLAHGFRLIREVEEYRPFRAVVDEIFDRFYAIEQIQQYTGFERGVWHRLFDAIALE